MNTDQRTLIQQARELSVMNRYGSEYMRESPEVLKALAGEVERLQAGAERLSDYCQHGPLCPAGREWRAGQASPVCTCGLEELLSHLLQRTPALVVPR